MDIQDIGKISIIDKALNKSKNVIVKTLLTTNDLSLVSEYEETIHLIDKALETIS